MNSENTANVVIVGLGFGAQVVRDLIQNKEDKIYVSGICDANPIKINELKAEFPQLTCYEDIDQFLNDPTIDGVVLLTGPIGRAKLLSKIIHAGKHVMTTKPFELDIPAAESVLKESKKLGKVIHLNSPNPTPDRSLQMIKNWQDTYNLGRPIAARAETWTYYEEDADGSWYDDPNKCPVAPVFRIGIYLINDLVSVFGKAKRVQSIESRILTGKPTPDNGQISIEFESGALANIFASFCIRDGDHYKNSISLNYERGSIYRNVGPTRSMDKNIESELTLITNKEMWAPREVRAEYSITKSNTKFGYDWDCFYDSIKEPSKAVFTDAQHVIEPLKIIQAMSLSSKEKRTIDL
jgi:predicted dehydrogenase